MKVTVVEHPVPVPEPPKTYEVTFAGLAQDEVVILRQALSTSEDNRSKVTGKQLESFVDAMGGTAVNELWGRNWGRVFPK